MYHCVSELLICLIAVQKYIATLAGTNSNSVGNKKIFLNDVNFI